MAIAHLDKSWRDAVARFCTSNSEITKKEEDAGTLSSTKISGKEVTTENTLVLFRKSDKLGFGEAMKKWNVVSEKKKRGIFMQL